MYNTVLDVSRRSRLQLRRSRQKIGLLENNNTGTAFRPIGCKGFSCTLYRFPYHRFIIIIVTIHSLANRDLISGGQLL